MHGRHSALLGEYKPRLSRSEYMEFQRGLAKTVEFDGATF